MKKENSELFENKHHYIYKITHVSTGRFYIGMRSSKVSPEEDDYWGSGLHIRLAIKKYGKEEFIKEILFKDIENREKLLDLEKQVVTQELVNDESCFNMKTGGQGGICTDEVRKKMSESHKGVPLSDKHKQAGAKARIGLKRTEETKKKMSESRLSWKMTSEQIENNAKARRKPISDNCKRRQLERARGAKINPGK